MGGGGWGSGRLSDFFEGGGPLLSEGIRRNAAGPGRSRAGRKANSPPGGRNRRFHCPCGTLAAAARPPGAARRVRRRAAAHPTADRPLWTETSRTTLPAQPCRLPRQGCAARARCVRLDRDASRSTRSIFQSTTQPCARSRDSAANKATKSSSAVGPAVRERAGSFADFKRPAAAYRLGRLSRYRAAPAALGACHDDLAVGRRRGPLALHIGGGFERWRIRRRILHLGWPLRNLEHRGIQNPQRHFRGTRPAPHDEEVEVAHPHYLAPALDSSRSPAAPVTETTAPVSNRLAILSNFTQDGKLTAWRRFNVLKSPP